MWVLLTTSWVHSNSECPPLLIMLQDQPSLALQPKYYANYAMHQLLANFFSGLNPLLAIMFGVKVFSAWGSSTAAFNTNGSSAIWLCTTAIFMSGIHQIAVPYSTLSKGYLILLIHLFHSFLFHTMGITTLVVLQSHLIPLGLPFSGFIGPFDYIVESESRVGIKSSDSGAVIGYQVIISPAISWQVQHVLFFQGLSLVHGKGVFISIFFFRTRMWTCYFSRPGFGTFWAGSTYYFSWNLLQILKWMPHLMNLIWLPLYYLHGFFTWLVPYLIVLNWIWVLALNLLNYGARLGISFFLCHWQIECWL